MLTGRPSMIGLAHPPAAESTPFRLKMIFTRSYDPARYLIRIWSGRVIRQAALFGKLWGRLLLQVTVDGSN